MRRLPRESTGRWACVGSIARTRLKATAPPLPTNRKFLFQTFLAKNVALLSRFPYTQRRRVELPLTISLSAVLIRGHSASILLPAGCEADAAGRFCLYTQRHPPPKSHPNPPSNKKEPRGPGSGVGPRGFKRQRKAVSTSSSQSGRRSTSRGRLPSGGPITPSRCIMSRIRAARP